ncbi:MAG: DUF493 family protein [Psychroflexus sp.]|jgi:putative lipoic acid-binding regulatory protein|nr:DUF493 family protein [Psychroflexus sp.]MDR9448221.1 DUF493 family protein [Psychroflexus sp.]
MKKPENSKEFYDNLEKKLAEHSEWPSRYMFKFIVPSSQEKVDQLKQHFSGMDARIDLKHSKKGTYTSVSVLLTMNSPQRVIQKYKQVGNNVEGVISL